MDLGEAERGVVATFIIDWPVMAFFGLLFGDLSKKRPWWRDPAFAGGAIASAGFTTVAMLSYRIAPDWMWMYYRKPEEMSAFVPWMPVGYMATFGAGFAAAAKLRGQERPVWPAAAGAVAAEVAVVAATWDRYHRIGTKEEWETGTASELVTAAPRGPAKKIGSYAPVVAAAFVAGLALARRSRAAASSR